MNADELFEIRFAVKALIAARTPKELTDARARLRHALAKRNPKLREYMIKLARN
jgi:hypothetical protein